jgi:DNA-binding HxlR family transcriptional regulator
METDGRAGPGGLDATDGAILRTLLRAAGVSLTLLDLKQRAGIGPPALTARVPRLERLGSVWRRPDGTTGLRCAYRLTGAGAARTHPTGS